MAITRIEFPTAGTPSVSTDYNLQNALTELLIKQGFGGYKLTTARSMTATAPQLAIGSYIRHHNAAYIVDTADYTILGTPATGLNYIKLSGTGSTITATWTQSLSGVSYSEIMEGWYDTSGDQIFIEGCYYDGTNFMTWKARDNRTGCTLVLATADSGVQDRVSADVICDGTADNVEIQLAIDVIAAQGGGTLELKYGTYDIVDDITLGAGVSIEGNYALLDVTDTSVSSVIDGSSATTNGSCIINKLRIDGYGSGSTAYGITCTAATTGFLTVQNCSINDCEYCFAFVKAINCYASGDGNGFYSCNSSRGCKATVSLTGYYDCSYLLGCEAYACQRGFNQCQGLNECQARSNTNYGFSSCRALGHNYAPLNGTNYYLSYADWAASVAAADTAAGGWNG